MSTDTDDTLPEVNELDAMKARADLLNITYHPSIGLDTLRKKVNAAINDMVDDTEDTSEETDMKPKKANKTAAIEETEGQRRSRLKKEASALIRVRVTCMNPAKREWDGEFITTGNTLIGSMTKYIPFNNEEGWHIPNMILEQLQQRQCQIFVTEKSKNGVAIRKGKLIKEYAIEVLDPLTQKELNELARRQAMTNSVD